MFFPFAPLIPQKIKMEKVPGDTIILHMCTTNDNHMVHSSWDMEHNGQNFLSFLDHFLPFLSYQSKNSKFWKNLKNTWRYCRYTQVYQKSLSYATLFLRYDGNFELFFVLLTPIDPKNQNLKKKPKKKQVRHRVPSSDFGT